MNTTDGGFQESVSHSCSDNIKCGTGVFECNICFDLAQDPVVTLCGHLFCWPCLYKWLQFHSYSHECPVCKALVDENNLVPIYGRGTSSSDLTGNPLSKDEIPRRPASRRPPTARAPELTYFRPDVSGAPWGSGFMPMATARLGNLSRTSLFGAVSSVLNLHVGDFHGTSAYVLSNYAHGGYVHGFHPYPIHVQGTKLVFLVICFLFIGVLVAAMAVSALLF